MFFTELSERLFPALVESVDDRQLVAAVDLNTEDGYEIYHEAHAISRLLFTSNFFTSPDFYGMLPEQDSEVEAHVRQYTFEDGTGSAMKEGLSTMIAFPINVLGAAFSQASDQGLPPVFEDLKDIAGTMRSSWFRDVCHQATVGANGFWGQDSVRKVSVPALAGFGTSNSFRFDFHSDEHSKTTFTFSEGSLRAIHKSIRERNQSHRSRLSGTDRAGEVAEDNWSKGSSSGCPVRHTVPHFPSPEAARRSLDGLAKHFAKSPAELTAPRAQTGIDIGLNHLAILLERAHALKLQFMGIAEASKPPVVTQVL